MTMTAVRPSVRPALAAPVAQRLSALALAAALILAAVAAAAQTLPPADPCATGRDLYRQGRIDEARRALSDCLDAQGENAEILIPLTVLGVRTGDLDAALGYGERAVKAAPTDPEAHYWYGRALLRADRPAEARSQWEAGLQQDLAHQGLLEGLARLALAEGRGAQAYQLLTQMQRQGLDEAWLHRLLADIAASKGLWSQALDHFDDVIAREAPSADDLLTASELSLMAGDGPRALDFCRQALRLEPGGAVYGGLGEAFFTLGEVDSALIYLRQAVALEPGNARHRFNLANALETVGLSLEAEDHFRAFLADRPDDAVGRFNYGVHLDKLGRVDEALEQVSRALQIEPGMFSAAVVRARLLEKLDRWDEALAEIERLRQLDPDNEGDLQAWAQRIETDRATAAGAASEGKVHLLHMILPEGPALDLVQAELEQGGDFLGLVVRYSVGPAAARGGDVGWIDPRDMVSPLREAIEPLGVNEISPPITSRGLIHLFKRIP